MQESKAELEEVFRSFILVKVPKPQCKYIENVTLSEKYKQEYVIKNVPRGCYTILYEVIRLLWSCIM